MSNEYETYDDVDFTYDYRISFEKENMPYLVSDLKPNIVWNYGDTEKIKFKIIRTDEQPIDLLDYNIIAKFYNFRGEVILENQFTVNKTDESVEFTIIIDSKQSKNIFKSGIYRMSISLEKDDTNLTILDRNKFIINVK